MSTLPVPRPEQRRDVTTLAPDAPARPVKVPAPAPEGPSRLEQARAWLAEHPRAKRVAAMAAANAFFLTMGLSTGRSSILALLVPVFVIAFVFPFFGKALSKLRHTALGYGPAGQGYRAGQKHYGRSARFMTRLLPWFLPGFALAYALSH